MRWRAFVAGSLLWVACGREGAADPTAAVAAGPAAVPLRLAWATHWGAPGGSALRSAVFDGAGNLYIAGGTERAAEWPRTAPAIGPLGDFDVIVAKFDPSGRNLWSVLIGGTGEDYAYVSALDREGNLVVGGRGGPAFPVTAGAFDRSFNGGRGRGSHGPTDGFLLSLTPEGALRWATYLGSGGDDIIRGIEILPDGDIAVSGGNTDAGDLPTTPAVVQPSLGGAKDAFIARLAPDGGSARFITYYGTSDDDSRGDETIRALAAHPSGDLWVGGTTQGFALTPTPDASQPERRGGASAFVMRLAPDGRAVKYLSWLGGDGDEDVETEGSADETGAFEIAGGTGSENFPVTPGAFAGGGGRDGWVARIAPDGGIAMAARFGGSGADHVFGPARDGAGNLYVAGTTTSTDLPVSQDALQASNAGGPSDALLAGFDRTGALAYATYFGGSDADQGRFAAADRPRGRIALIGETRSVDLPLRNAAQASPGAVFVAVFEGAPLAEPPSEAAPQTDPRASADE
jgi:hypothetical protein